MARHAATARALCGRGCALTEIVPLDTVEPDAVEDLLDRAFGADRRARTAYRVRGESRALAALSFAAIDGGALVGSVQCWQVRFSADGGGATPLVMLGPVAVAPERQRDGLGRRLTAAALAAAEAESLACAMALIGDPEYYGRFFGFTAERTGGWRLPGPVERRRLLARGPGVPDGAGELGPA